MEFLSSFLHFRACDNMAGWPMVLGGVIAAVLGILSSVELDDVDVLLVERAVSLPKSRARTFSFVSNLANYAEVLIL